MSEKLEAPWFRPFEDYFWCWAEDGETAETYDGQTIIYKEDLINILEALQKKGWPGPTSTMLLLFAFRDLRGLEVFLKNKREYLKRVVLNQEQVFIVESVFEYLKLFSQLPVGFRTEDARVTLLEIFMHYCGERIPHPTTTEWLINFSSGRADIEKKHLGMFQYGELLEKDLRAIMTFRQKFPTLESLITVVRTGVEEIPEPVENIPEVVTQSLMEQLEADSRTESLANLSRHLTAAIHIPIHTHGASDQSFGGVSDISNRGTFDKLLLSELANDDHTLMARLANNEALFLRREELPEEKSKHRVILLDSTIRMMGKMRLFGMAATLTLQAQAERDGTCSIIQLTGSNKFLHNFNTKEDVITALETRDVSLHCSKTLMDFFRTFREDDDTECIFITEEDNFTTPAFIAAFNSCRQFLKYLIVLKRTGKLHFYELRESNKKLISEGDFDLDELLSLGRGRSKIQNQDGFWPAFYDHDEAPLFFPCNKPNFYETSCAFIPGAGACLVTTDHRWLFWSDRNKGALELFYSLPRGRFCFGTDSQGILIAFCLHDSGSTIFKYNLVSGKSSKHHFLGFDQAFITELTIYAKKGDQYVSIDPATLKMEDISRETYSTKYNFSLNRNFKSERNRIKAFVNPGFTALTRVESFGLTQYKKLYLDKHYLRTQSGNCSFEIKNDIENNRALSFQSPVEYTSSPLRNEENKYVKIRKHTLLSKGEFWTDTRGLVHLKPSNPDLDEITIVNIVGMATTLWASSGVVCGNPYFIKPGAGKIISPSEFDEKILTPVLNSYI